MAKIPLVSVVLCTYNRASRLPAVCRSVLDQSGVDFELVVVDDGSADPTPEVLRAIDDDRLRVVRRPNGGLCVARNTGLENARGHWTVFLDDDDLPEPGWLSVLTEPTSDPAVGVTCCGGTVVDVNGQEIGIHRPKRKAPFEVATLSYLPGTFLARTDLLREIGGYLPGLGAAHQKELFLRLTAVLSETGLHIVSSDVPALRIERRDATDRPVVNPRALFDGARWILARHPSSDDPVAAADSHGVIGVSGARLGEWRIARRHLGWAIRKSPRSLRAWGRLALANVPSVGTRFWARQGNWSTHNAAEVGVLRQWPGEPSSGEREYFLPWRYEENPPASSDARGTPYWAEGLASSNVRNQAPVYRLAARLARKNGWSTALDVGCGSGNKLVKYLSGVTQTIGVDQSSAITLARQQFPDQRWIEGDLEEDAIWKELARIEPALTLCVDVVEHVDDPVNLLHRLAEVSGGAPVLISTPDRRRYDPERVLGPPRNRRHIREWTNDQFELLLLSTGFHIDDSWHLLPRSYSATRTELNRAAYRALTLKAVPDRRSCMAYLVRSRPPESGQGYIDSQAERP